MYASIIAHHAEENRTVMPWSKKHADNLENMAMSTHILGSKSSKNHKIRQMIEKCR